MQLGLFYWTNLEKSVKEGKQQRRFSMESGVLVVWGRHSEGRKYEREVKGRVEEGVGRIAAKQRDRQEGKSRF